MSHIYSSLHLAISKKLGWDDMLASVALPAIDRIITNHASHISDCTGDVLPWDTVAESLLMDSWTSDDVFSLLLSPDYVEWNSNQDVFISLRDEIEMYMFLGDSHEEAITEWYK